MTKGQPNAEATNISRTLTSVDLFAGAGGFSLAALNCGIKVLGAIELDKNACETYKANIVKSRSPETRLHSENIFEIDPCIFRQSLGLKKGELDILLGGPPCQGFSTHRINDSGVEDPRNQLLIRYFDFVRELSPKMFLVENVPGLLWPRHADYLSKFVSLARRHGYSVLKPVKLNAKDYGVPQNRQRVFILGLRSELNRSELQWPPAPTHFRNNKHGPVWRTASQVFPRPPERVIDQLAEQLGKPIVDALVFGDELPPASTDSSAITMNHTTDLIERFKNTPINGSRLDASFRLPCHDEEYDGHKDVYGRIRLAQPGPTITTGCFNPSKGRFLHPWLNHGIAVRYAARFQTFPDSFEFQGGITSQGKQVGNAVPVLLGEHLLHELQRFLNNF